MIAKGRVLVGENHSQAKLTEEQVRLIRKKFKEGYSIRDINFEFNNVTESNIGLIVRRKSWVHI